MNLSSHQLEEDSAHYYIPQSEENSEFLYSPVSVGYFNCTPAYKVQRHNYNNYLLIIMLSGSLSYKALWGSGIVRPGYALLLDCHQPHSYRANGKCSFLFMHFKGAQSKEICEKSSPPSDTSFACTIPALYTKTSVKFSIACPMTSESLPCTPLSWYTVC